MSPETRRRNKQFNNLPLLLGSRILSILVLAAIMAWMVAEAISADRGSPVFTRGQLDAEPPMVATTNQERLMQFQETKDSIQDLQIAELGMTVEMHAAILIELQADRNRVLWVWAGLTGLLGALQIINLVAQIIEIRSRR